MIFHLMRFLAAWLMSAHRTAKKKFILTQSIVLRRMALSNIRNDLRELAAHIFFIQKRLQKEKLHSYY